jgi:undecaprenyl diphosphate synthase
MLSPILFAIASRPLISSQTVHACCPCVPSHLQECKVLEQRGVQVRVIGDLALAPAGVQAAAMTIMAATQHHSAAVLNICFSYT